MSLRENISPSGPGPPRVRETGSPPVTVEDTPDPLERRKVEGSLNAEHQQTLEEGADRTEERSTLKPPQVAFESESEGSVETEITPDDISEGVAETAGAQPIPVQADNRDGKGKIVLTTEWLVETVEDGTSMRLLFQKKDGSFEARKFPSW